MAKASKGGAKAPFVFLHVGDLHLVAPKEDDTPADAREKQRLEADVNAILAEIATLRGEGFDFVYLPGDIADDGEADQYAILEAALRDHPAGPLHLIPGDHDRQHGRMEDFERFRNGTGLPKPFVHEVDMDGDAVTLRQYYYAATINDVRCLFLDMVSAGHGRKGVGLDFRLGKAQAQWFADQVRDTLREDGTARIPCAVFMHTYPADIRVRSEATDVAGAIWNGRVRLVEMGHTHYNEITPDGRTHYAAARSVGQNEDGSTGYAVCALDGGVVSWRFKPSDRDWPFVMITAPADRRVATAGREDADTIALRARAERPRGRALPLPRRRRLLAADGAPRQGRALLHRERPVAGRREADHRRGLAHRRGRRDRDRLRPRRHRAGRHRLRDAPTPAADRHGRPPPPRLARQGPARRPARPQPGRARLVSALASPL